MKKQLSQTTHSFTRKLKIESINYTDKFDFEILLNLTGSIIIKRDTRFRKVIPAQERLTVTLRFLATEDSYHSFMYTFKISKQAISSIIPKCI